MYVNNATCVYTCIGILRFSALQHFWQACSRGFSGDTVGDGTLLGASLVVGPGEQGILFQHQAKEFGDHGDLTDIANAVDQIKIDT